MPSNNRSLNEALQAIYQFRALLEDEQTLDPVEVEEFIEDENGDVHSIRLEEEIEAALACVRSARSATYPLGLDFPDVDFPKFDDLIKKLTPKKAKVIKYLGKDIKVLPWADLSRPWENRTPVVVVNVSDGSWYGPYENTGLATKSAMNISKRGDNQRKRVPMSQLRMVREKDWPPARATFDGELHRMAARKSK